MTTTRHLRFLLICLLPAFALTALAQVVAPSISLSSARVAPGEILRFDARQLTPDSEYRLRLEGPSNLSIERALRSDPNGAVRYETELDTEGEWTLHFVGSDIELQLGFEVVAGAPVTEEPPGRQGLPATGNDPAGAQDGDGAEAQLPGADDPESETEPAPVAPDQVVPDTIEGPADPPTQTTADPGTLSGSDIDFTTIGSDLIAITRDGSEEVWRLEFLPGSGGNSQALFHEGTVYLGKGLALLEIDPLSGRVLERHRLPGPATRLEAIEGGVSGRLDTPADAAGRGFLLQDGTLRWQDDALEARRPLTSSPYPADSEIFDWLRLEAEVADPLARLEQDPTNPFLHLRAGESLSSENARLGAFEDALEQAETFFERARLAQELFELGAPQLAARAMDAALEDFAARGYDPRLLTDLEQHRAYGFPLPRFEAALARGDLAEARFWAPWVHTLAADSVPETEEALREFARQLRSAGDRDAAAQWRARSDLPGRGGLISILDRLFEALGRVGWYAVASLLIAIVALHLTLIAKYWRPQAVLGAERRGGRSPSPLAHLLAIRYYSFVEKVVLVLLFAAAIALAGLAIWQEAAADSEPYWQRGTFADLPNSLAIVQQARDSGEPVGRFVAGFIAQSQGDIDRALEAYREAGDFAPALNNLAALGGDETLFARALEIDPRLPEARFNAGRIDDPSPFHDRYRQAQPLLATPTPSDVRVLMAGDWRQALGRTFSDPWNTFRNARAPGLQSAWLWWTALVLFALAAVATLLWLVVPRPRLARNAPRTIAYQILALLFPGSGLADELWGLLLLTPWAIFGLDALTNYFGWGPGLGVGLGVDLVVLAGLYLVNAAAFFVELSSYNRRMRDLKRKDPEMALRYGMRVRDSARSRVQDLRSDGTNR